MNTVHQKNAQLWSIARKQTECSRFDHAIEVAKKISDNTQGYSLSHVCETLAGSGHDEKAIKTSNMISDLNVKAETLGLMSQALVDKDRLERAAEVANSIVDDDTRKFALKLIKESKTS